MLALTSLKLCRKASSTKRIVSLIINCLLDLAKALKRLSFLAQTKVYLFWENWDLSRLSLYGLLCFCFVLVFCVVV